MSDFEMRAIRVVVDDECSKHLIAHTLNTVSFKLKDVGEMVASNIETYDALITFFAQIEHNREKFERDVSELSRTLTKKIVDTYEEFEEYTDSPLYAKIAFWKSLMIVFSAIMLEESIGLGNNVAEFIKRELGGVEEG